MRETRTGLTILGPQQSWPRYCLFDYEYTSTFDLRRYLAITWQKPGRNSPDVRKCTKSVNKNHSIMAEKPLWGNKDVSLEKFIPAGRVMSGFVIAEWDLYEGTVLVCSCVAQGTEEHPGQTALIFFKALLNRIAEDQPRVASAAEQSSLPEVSKVKYLGVVVHKDCVISQRILKSIGFKRLRETAVRETAFAKATQHVHYAGSYSEYYVAKVEDIMNATVKERRKKKVEDKGKAPEVDKNTFSEFARGLVLEEPEKHDEPPNVEPVDLETCLSKAFQEWIEGGFKDQPKQDEDEPGTYTVTIYKGRKPEWPTFLK